MHVVRGNSVEGLRLICRRCNVRTGTNANTVETIPTPVGIVSRNGLKLKRRSNEKNNLLRLFSVGFAVLVWSVEGFKPLEQHGHAVTDPDHHVIVSEPQDRGDDRFWLGSFLFLGVLGVGNMAAGIYFRRQNR